MGRRHDVEGLHMLDSAQSGSLWALLGDPLLRLAMDACPTALLITDPEGVIAYVNRMFTRFTGLNAAEVVGRTPRILKSGKMPDEIYRDMWKTIRAGRPWRGRIINRRKSRSVRLHGAPEVSAGEFYWSHLSIAPIVDSENTVLGYVAAHLDISEQVRIEERRQFERNEAQTRAEVARILHSPLPLHDRLDESLATLMKLEELHVLQRGGIFLYSLNRDRLNLTVTRGEFSPEFLEKECALAPGACLCGRAAVSGELLISDDCFQDQRHEHTYANMARHGHYIVPLRAGGDVLGVLFLYTDPHPSRDETRIDTLRSVGDAIGVAIANDQLTQRLIAARDEARSASIAKGAFLANMSHEIRTPLTAILGFAEMIAQDNPTAAERCDAVQTIHRNAHHLLELVNDLLDLSKIEAGKLPIERVRCCLTEVLSEVADLLRQRAEAKGLRLEVQRSEALPEWILTDPTRLRQILVNLLANAIKFTRTGTVRIAASLKTTEDKPFLVFDVVDSGIGMTADQAARLFRPFVQGDDSTTREFGGTGLGLTISKRLAQMLGGDVVLIDSQVGRGTHFCFTMAVVPAPGDAESTQEFPSATSPAAKSQGHDSHALRDLNILLVEDSPDNQRLIRAFLERAGATVTLAANGEQAIDRVCAPTEPAYTVVLMDMQMPVIDGYAATRALRARGVRTPIIALTANAMVGARNACLEAGCDDFATKPINRNDLIATILRVTVPANA